MRLSPRGITGAWTAVCTIATASTAQKPQAKGKNSPVRAPPSASSVTIFLRLPNRSAKPAATGFETTRTHIIAAMTTPISAASSPRDFSQTGK